MKKILLYTVFFLSVMTNIQAERFIEPEEMLRDLDVIRNTFEVKYAPAGWKREQFQWELIEEIEQAKMQVLQKDALTVKEYHQIVKNFFNSTQDYHVGVHFISTEMAFLPFRIQSAGGRYFIAAIDDKALSKKAKQLKVGDELISFNGKPVKKVLDELRAQDHSSHDKETDHALNEQSLTARMGSRGQVVPKGNVVIELLDSLSGKVKAYDFEWDYYGELIKSFPLCSGFDNSWPALPKQDILKHPFFHKNMTVPFHSKVLAAKKKVYAEEEEDDEWIHQAFGYKKSKLPNLGSVIWEAKKDSSFHAYIYKDAKGKRIGFIRIPSFNVYDPSESAEEFAEIISLFETYTDSLVIDQLDNPGGDMFYMYALLSMLTDKPLEIPTQQETITQQDVMFTVELLDLLTYIKENSDRVDITDFFGDDFSGYHVNEHLLDGIIDYCRFIIAEWNSEHIFSEPYYLYGVDKIHPDPNACYTKPILLLINELDFSCGDFFPAILQDNKRATLIGAKTSGAGGYVIPAGHYNRLGIESYSLTGSIAERSTGGKIENNGVSPDIPYTITPDDLQNQYRGFLRFIESKRTKDEG